MFTFSIKFWIWSFSVVVLQRTAKKCTKMYNAREEPLFCELKSIVNVLVVVVVFALCLSSLLRSVARMKRYRQKYIRRSLYLVLGCVPSLLHVRLFLERGRARKMRQLSINHHDARIPPASFACRCVAKSSFHLFFLFCLGNVAYWSVIQARVE